MIEARVIEAFERHLVGEGWSVRHQVDFCDLVAARDEERLFVEAKGRTAATGTDVDTMYGQILRRMPIADDPAARFAVAVPERARNAVLRVQPRVRQLLRVDVYLVAEDGSVSGPL